MAVDTYRRTTTKTCPECGRTLSTSAFYQQKNMTMTIPFKLCKDCYNRRRKARRDANQKPPQINVMQYREVLKKTVLEKPEPEKRRGEPSHSPCTPCKFLTVCKAEVWRASYILPCFAESPRHELWLRENRQEAEAPR